MWARLTLAPEYGTKPRQQRMRRFVVGKFAVAMAVIAALVIGSGATAAGRWVISNVGQIKPSVRAQLSAVRVITTYGPNVTLGTGNSSIQSSVAACPRGTVVTGGGWYGSNSPASVATSAPNANGWLVVMQANSSEKESFQALARCEYTGGH